MSAVYGIALKDGKPVKGIKVELLSPTGEVNSHAETGTDGTFQFPAEAGIWTVRWTTSDGTDEGQVEITEGGDAEVEIEVD
jgi:uncharacterized protein YfaS (alpha-2-macroglobulin family)